jgi:hypothetical protein
MKNKWYPLIVPYLKGKVILPQIGERVIVTHCYSDYQTFARFTGKNFIEISTHKPIGATHWKPCPKSPVKVIDLNKIPDWFDYTMKE